MAASWFGRQDRDGDGVLRYDEMEEGMRGERERWDTNGDGVIDQAEFQRYAQARMQQRQDERGQTAGKTAPGSRGTGPSPGEGSPPGASSGESRRPTAGSTAPPQSRPVVYRPGNLPQGLPSWFADCDQDRDGQVGLYEWRRHGDRLEEFHRFDLNNDGFVTVEEVLRSLTWAAQVADARKESSGGFSFGMRSGMGPGRGGFGGRPDMSSGPGGFQGRFGGGPGGGGPGGGGPGGGGPGGGGPGRGPGSRGR